MTALPTSRLVAVADYLAGELESDTRHEYLGGVIHAMAGASNLHNRIARRILVALSNRLGGNPCEAWGSDTKIRVKLARQTRFYYPDVSVTCDEVDPKASFHDDPQMVVEVLSDSTRRIDTTEKFDSYLSIPALQLYVLVEPDRPEITIHRRGEQGFVAEVYSGEDAVVPLPEFDTELPLAEVYG